MELSVFFKSVIDQDRAPVVLCDLDHIIIYMNPAAVRNYAKRGGEKLIGQSLLACHNPHSQELIQRTVAWFRESPEHNIIYEFRNEKDNRDVYTVALRDADGTTPTRVHQRLSQNNLRKRQISCETTAELSK